MKGIIIVVFGSLTYLCGVVVGLADCDCNEGFTQRITIGGRNVKGKVGSLKVKTLDCGDKYSLYGAK